MAFQGNEIVPIALAHVGERYVLGARAPVLNPNWKGPWDCAEFATWCAYQAYGIYFGGKPHDPRRGDAYTGFWSKQSVDQDLQVSIASALSTPGAFLLRRPRREKIGHIAISLGDGKLVEAAGAKLGVVRRRNTKYRRWDAGVHLPGVAYEISTQQTWAEPAAIIRVTDPYKRGTRIKRLHKRLAKVGYDGGSQGEIYDEVMEAAVVAFQAERGLIVDGEVGPETAKELGLKWPSLKG